MKRHLIVGLPAALFLLSMVASASATPPMLRYQATELLQGISRFIKPTSNIKFLLPRSTSTQLS